MRDGLAVSLFSHAALLAWALLSLPSPRPLDASQVEAIPIDFVRIADITSIPKGVDVPKPVEEPKPDPVALAIAEQTPPLPEPEPVPPVPKPPEPAPVAAPSEPPPPEPAPPEEPPPEPQAAPEPEPPPPEEPPPAPPPEETVAIQPKPETMPVPKSRPKMVAEAKQEPDTLDIDKIAALLDKDKAAAEPQKPQPSLGGTTSAVDAQMTATEFDALRARLAECWSPPIGWTESSEVRVVLLLSLNSDGSLSGEPQVVERPGGRYEQTAAESALRAVRRCAPFALPPEKYEHWKQINITFDPKEMGGG